LYMLEKQHSRLNTAALAKMLNRLADLAASRFYYGLSAALRKKTSASVREQRATLVRPTIGALTPIWPLPKAKFKSEVTPRVTLPVNKNKIII
jgi:hypothetical protein